MATSTNSFPLSEPLMDASVTMRPIEAPTYLMPGATILAQHKTSVLSLSSSPKRDESLDHNCQGLDTRRLAPQQILRNVAEASNRADR